MLRKKLTMQPPPEVVRLSGSRGAEKVSSGENVVC